MIGIRLCVLLFFFCEKIFDSLFLLQDTPWSAAPIFAGWGVCAYCVFSSSPFFYCGHSLNASPIVSRVGDVCLRPSLFSGPRSVLSLGHLNAEADTPTARATSRYSFGSPLEPEEPISSGDSISTTRH